MVDAHYHVTSETDGVLKDSEVLCTNDRKMAARALVGEVSKLASDLAEGCDRDGCGFCGWCTTARVARSRATVNEALFAELGVGLSDSYTVLVLAPRDQVMSVMLNEVATPYASCDHHA